MAPRSAAKKKAPARKQQRREESDAVDVVQALGDRLAQLGQRKWTLAELQAALSKAVGGLADEGVRAHIQANLERCAAALHERLAAAQPAEAMEEDEQQEQQQEQEQQQQGQAAKRAKRTGKKAAAATGPGVEAPAEEAEQLEEQAAEPPSLSTAAGYAALVEGEVAGRPDARFSPAALLLARRLPGEELVRAHVRRVLPDALPDVAGAAPAVAAARAALGLCAALASEAAGPEEALHAFAPAVSQLGEAAQQLAAAQAGAAAQQQQQRQQHAGLARELHQLAGRALAAMYAALLQQRLALRSGSSQAASSSSYWRANPQALPPAAAAEAACTVAAAACCLLTELRLRQGSSQAGSGRSGRPQIESLAAAAAGDLRQLAPYASSGLLMQLAGTAQEEVCSSSEAARRFLVLYGGAAKQEVVGEQDYLSRLVAARKAAAAARHLGEEALATTITAEACSLPASQEFVGWLRDQPPSSIVAAALDAAGRGLDALSKHLVQECSERALQGLLAAMRRGGTAASAAASTAAAAAGAEGEGAAAAEEDAAMDDLLFFADKEGDATMFGRDWHMDSEEEEEEEEEGGSGGLQLGSLPGGEGEGNARRRSVGFDGED
ncbi:hypothetical protein ABPG75_011526 [Micractinium tetrahymenae]